MGPIAFVRMLLAKLCECGWWSSPKLAHPCHAPCRVALNNTDGAGVPRPNEPIGRVKDIIGQLNCPQKGIYKAEATRKPKNQKVRISSTGSLQREASMGHHNHDFSGDVYALTGVWGPPTSWAK